MRYLINIFVLYRSKFIEYGNDILAAIVLVTCPCDLLYEQLQSLVHRSPRLPSTMNWLSVIRPDWFDINYDIQSSVQRYFIIKNILETRQNQFSNDQIIKLVMENSELDSYRTVLIRSIMENQQWELIHLFAKHEHDWLFLTTQSTKVKFETSVLFLIFICSYPNGYLL